MLVVSTEYSQILAANVADALGCPVGGVRFTRFPDGEHYLRVGALDPEMVVVGSVPDSDAMVQLLLLMDACAASEITLVIPYMAYARQDKQFHEGEPLSARAVAAALSRGASRVFTVNIHDPRVLPYFQVPAANLSLAGDIARYLSTCSVSDPLILAPDDGAAKFAGDVARTGGWDSDHLDKTRISGDEVRMAPKSLSALGRDVVIVDDIISTGGTLSTAAGMLYEQGARSVSAACVHGVLAEGAYLRLLATRISGVVCSDTLERACSRYSAGKAIADGIRGCS
ncbi:MAG: ribose-phosphate diphosphokinase [Methanoregulaceae archaeon]|nr:ribose-phosphate diphosphokinase [Methanoregulaceae archaeon]